MLQNLRLNYIWLQNSCFLERIDRATKFRVPLISYKANIMLPPAFFEQKDKIISFSTRSRWTTEEVEQIKGIEVMSTDATITNLSCWVAHNVRILTPYECTHAHPTLMSTSKRLSRYILRLTKPPWTSHCQQVRHLPLTVNRYVSYHWKNN